MTSQYDGEKTRPTASVAVEEKHEWTCLWCGNLVVGKFIHKCMVCDHTYNSEPPMAVYCGQPYIARAARATTATISQMCWVCSCEHANDMTYPDCTNCGAARDEFCGERIVPITPQEHKYDAKEAQPQRVISEGDSTNCEVSNTLPPSPSKRQAVRARSASPTKRPRNNTWTLCDPNTNPQDESSGAESNDDCILTGSLFDTEKRTNNMPSRRSGRSSNAGGGVKVKEGSPQKRPYTHHSPAKPRVRRTVAERRQAQRATPSWVAQAPFDRGTGTEDRDDMHRVQVRPEGIKGTDWDTFAEFMDKFVPGWGRKHWTKRSNTHRQMRLEHLRHPWRNLVVNYYPSTGTVLFQGKGNTPQEATESYLAFIGRHHRETRMKGSVGTRHSLWKREQAKILES